MALKHGKKGKQIFWDSVTERQFTELVGRYDIDLPVARAIVKLIKQAIADNYLPGYIRQEKEKPKGTNTLANDLDTLARSNRLTSKTTPDKLIEQEQ